MREFIVPKPDAEIIELKGLKVRRLDTLRVYKCSPRLAMLQIRTNKPITESGSGVCRQMLAGVTIDKKECQSIIDYLQEVMSVMNS